MESTGRINAELRKLMNASYDVCQCCGASFPEEIAAYAGYSHDDLPVYVGECCREVVRELATYVYWWWEVDKRCEPDLHLWRYMDFSKFIGMLEGSELYFPRADQFSDPFEGAVGIEETREKWNAFYLDYFRQAIRTAPGQSKSCSEDHVDREARRLLEDLVQIGNIERSSSFVSCWHANTGESEALWRLYCPPPVTGVVIETTVEKLGTAINVDGTVKIGRVQYVDFTKNFSGFHDRIFWKRKSLSHESEVRAVITDRNNDGKLGISKHIDISSLVISVIPSPFAPIWFPILLEKIITRYKMDIQIRKSEILSVPFY